MIFTLDIKKKVAVMEVDNVEEEEFVMTETSVLKKGKKLQEEGLANGKLNKIYSLLKLITVVIILN